MMELIEWFFDVSDAEFYILLGMSVFILTWLAWVVATIIGCGHKEDKNERYP